MSRYQRRYIPTDHRHPPTASPRGTKTPVITQMFRVTVGRKSKQSAIINVSDRRGRVSQMSDGGGCCGGNGGAEPRYLCGESGCGQAVRIQWISGSMCVSSACAWGQSRSLRNRSSSSHLDLIRTTAGAVETSQPITACPASSAPKSARTSAYSCQNTSTRNGGFL